MTFLISIIIIGIILGVNYWIKTKVWENEQRFW